MKAFIKLGEPVEFLDYRTGKYESGVAVEFEDNLVLVRDASGAIRRVPEYQVDPPNGSIVD